MWQRFTERARRAVFFAQEEAGRLGENHVSTEHLLLGLIRETDSAAVKMLTQLGAQPERIKSEIEHQIPRGEGRRGQDMQLTARAKKVIDLANDEARRLNSNYIGSEHLLLAITRVGGQAAQILAGMGVGLEQVRGLVGTIQGSIPQDELISAVEATALRHRSITAIQDLSSDEIELILSTASLLKETGKGDPNAHQSLLAGRTLAMIFEKPSLRTRVTFEVGMTQMGGHAIYLAPSDIQLRARESVPDVARNLSRWCDVIMARVFSHHTITELAGNATVPVINGLSDLEHPCQAFADFQTIRERKGELKGLKLTFIGDGNNVANSLMLLAAKVGTDFVIACPEGYEPLDSVVQSARESALETGASIEVVEDPNEAVRGADVLYTDVWTSMGQESEAAIRKEAFMGYQINQTLLGKAKPDAIVLHCLPAHRGQEITDEVLDGPQSAVLDEAENRLHAQKAILALVV